MKNLKLKTNMRPFVMLYFDFIKCSLLNWNEKDIYIILLMYAEKDSKQCFPSVSKLCKISGKSKNTVLKAIKGLEDKKLLKREKRITKKGQTSNLYTLYDIDTIWKSESVEELKAAVDEIEEKQMIDLLIAKGYYITKEKEPTSAPTKVTDVDPNENSSDMNKNNTNKSKSQELERYTIDQIHQLFDYDIMLQENPYQQNDIDSAMSVLYTAMNTTKATIRIAGEDKPTMSIISKLMKLDKESIMYALEKFSTQTERIKNPASYLLTVLYFAPEQFHLDIQNKVSHDMAHWNTEE